MAICMIIANKGYQDIEYSTPKKIFEENGFEVVTAGKEKGQATGKLGGNTLINISLNEVDVKEFKAIIFIGGPGAVTYIEDVNAHLIARDAEEEGVVLGAICIAPLILAHAGVLKDKKATSYDSNGKSKERFGATGAVFIEADVVQDGNIITANGPKAAQEFGEKIVEVLKSKQKPQ